MVGNVEAQLLEGLRACMEKDRVSDADNLCVGEDLCKFIRDRWGLPNLRLETVSRTLKNHGLIIGTKRPRLDNGHQRTAYIIDRGRLKKLTDEYFETSEIM